MIWSWDEQQEGTFKYWDKLAMIANATKATLAGEKSYEWVLMIDYDTLITNTSVSLDELVRDSLQQAEKEGKNRDDIDMIVTPDWYGTLKVLRHGRRWRLTMIAFPST